MSPLTIEQLLAELYEADPTLVAKEVLLRPLLAELMEGKPDAVFSPDVRARIKQTLLEKASSAARPSGSLAAQLRPYWGLAVAVIVVLVVIPVLHHPKEELAFTPALSTTTDHAFGPLTDANTGEPPKAVQTDSFVYNGPLNLEQGDVSVLRRENISLTQDALAGLVDSFDLGTKLDEQLVSAPASASVNLSQDREFGYDVVIDYTRGSVSIEQDTEHWPVQSVASQSESLPRPDAVGISDTFLTEHGITTDGYGEAVVTGDSTVVYPMIADGLPVYEENGAPFGVEVSVDAATERVTSVRNLATRKYASSPYEGVTDDSVLREALKDGGWRDGGTGAQDSVKAVELVMPERAWMRTLTSEPEGEGTEILVPALVFPVASVSADDAHGQERVVIPLASELYD